MQSAKRVSFDHIWTGARERYGLLNADWSVDFHYDEDGGTACTISARPGSAYDARLRWTGRAFLHPEDRPIKWKGRNVAFQRAFAAMKFDLGLRRLSPTESERSRHFAESPLSCEA